MAKHNSNAWLCLYPSNISIQQPDSKSTTVQCALRELELLLLIAVATDQRLCWWSVGRGWSNRCTFWPWDHSNPRLVAQNCGIFLSTFAGPRVVFLTAYQFSYMLDIPFRSDSPRSSTAGLQRDRFRCVNLAQKISNRTDCPLLVRKLFTNVLHPILLLDEGV